jgi:hypothetical protein
METDMAKAPAKKAVPAKKIALKKVASKKEAKNKEPIDYFKLPFEVYYSERITVTQYEFKSDIKPKTFKDVKAVHMEQGRSWGTSFSCDENNGPELYCCLMNNHDEVEPSWLSFMDEDDTDFNYGGDFAVQINGNEVIFVNLTDEQADEDSEEFLDVDGMDYCCSYAFGAYHIGEADPDYIILDADNSRIKIDLEGYELDEDGERIESSRIINTDELDEEKYEDYETLELYDAKNDWIKLILEKDFPKDKKLTLSYKSE